MKKQHQLPWAWSGTDAAGFYMRFGGVMTRSEFFAICRHFLDHNEVMLLEPLAIAFKETDVLQGEHLLSGPICEFGRRDDPAFAALTAGGMCSGPLLIPNARERISGKRLWRRLRVSADSSTVLPASL